MTTNQIITAEIVLACITAVATAFFLFIRITKKPIYGLLTKTFASICFVTMGVLAIAFGNFAGHSMPFGSELFLIGLACGMVGDIVLDLKRAHSEYEDLYLYSGMGAFSLGHIANITGVCFMATGLGSSEYIASIMRVDSILLPVIISFVIGAALAPVIIIVSEKFLKNVFGKFRIISGFYAGLLVSFTILSLWLTILNTNYLLLLIGMVLFLASDLVLSTMYFVPGKKEDKLLVIVNHGAYYAAQIMLCCFLYSLIH